MNIAIYQINPDRDENNVAFLCYENLERFQGNTELRSEIYDKVFEGEVDCGTLEEVYHIFFDWDNKGSSGPQAGQADHVGIVQKVENGIVYTVEGNSGDSCRVNQYPVGYYEILGYGVVAY